MHARGAVLLIFLCPLAPAGAQEPPKGAVTLHVAPDGSDANPGTRDRPFARLEAARDAIRGLRRRQGGTLRQPVHVLFRGGTYVLEAPLLLTPEDSGTAACPVVYQPLP